MGELILNVLPYGLAAAAAAPIVAVVTALILAHYVPAILYAVSPQHSGALLRGMSDWLLGHSRMLEMVVGIGFGAIFLAKGIASF